MAKMETLTILLLLWYVSMATGQTDDAMHDYSRQKGNRQRAFYGDKKHPAKSCRDIFKQMPNLPSGVYWLDVHDWENNKTIQERTYCQNTLSNETKTGMTVKGKQGAIGVEDLSLGEPPPEPFDWEELTDGNWPLPVTPPTEEEMQSRLKQAVKDYKEKQSKKGSDNSGSNIILNQTTSGFFDLPESTKILGGITSGFVDKASGSIEKGIGSSSEDVDDRSGNTIVAPQSAAGFDKFVANSTSPLPARLDPSYPSQARAFQWPDGSWAYNSTPGMTKNEMNFTGNSMASNQNNWSTSFIPVGNESYVNEQYNTSNSELGYESKTMNASSQTEKENVSYYNNGNSSSSNDSSNDNNSSSSNNNNNSSNSTLYDTYNGGTGSRGSDSARTFSANWNQPFNRSIENSTVPADGSLVAPGSGFMGNKSLGASNVTDGMPRSQYLPVTVSGISQSTGSIVFRTEANETTALGEDEEALDSMYRKTINSSDPVYNTSSTQNATPWRSDSKSYNQSMLNINEFLFRNSSRNDSVTLLNQDGLTSAWNLSRVGYDDAQENNMTNSSINAFSNDSSNYQSMPIYFTNESSYQYEATRAKNEREASNASTGYEGNQLLSNAVANQSPLLYSSLNTTDGMHDTRPVQNRMPYELIKEMNASVLQGNEGPKLKQMVYTKEETSRSRNGSGSYVDYGGKSIGASKFIEKTHDLKEHVLILYDNGVVNKSGGNPVLPETVQQAPEGNVKRGSVNASVDLAKEATEKDDRNGSAVNNTSGGTGLQSFSNFQDDNSTLNSSDVFLGDNVSQNPSESVPGGGALSQAYQQLDRLNATLNNFTSSLDNFERNFRLFNTSLDQAYASLNETLRLANSTLVPSLMSQDNSLSENLPERNGSVLSSKLKNSVHMYVINWKKIVPFGERDASSSSGDGKSASKPEKGELKEKSSFEKDASKKNVERDGLFVKPGLNRGFIQMVVSKDDVNTTKQKSILGKARWNVLERPVIDNSNRTPKKTETGHVANSSLISGESLDIRTKQPGKAPNSMDPDQLNHGLWTAEAKKYTSKAEEDFAKQQKYLKSNGNKDAYDEMIKEYNSVGVPATLNDPSRADATKEKMKDFYNRNDDIVRGKGGNVYVAPQKADSAQNSRKLSSPLKTGDDANNFNSKMRLSSSTSSGSESEAGTNTWAEVGSKVDAGASSQSEVAEDPNLLSNVDDSREAVDDIDDWSLNDDGEEEEYANYNRPQGLGLWTDTGTGVGVSIGTGASAGSDTSSQNDFPPKWSGFGPGNGFGMGMGTSAGSQSGAETMTETSVSINSEAGTSSQSGSESDAGSKPSGSRSRYKWKMGPASRPFLAPSPTNHIRPESKLDNLLLLTEKKPNPSLAYSSNALPLKEISPFKAAPQLGVQANTQVNTKVQVQATAQSQAGSNTKPGSRLKNTSHGRLKESKQRLSELVKGHNERLESNTLNNPLRKMKQTEKTPMQLKLEEVGHKTRNKPRGPRPGGGQGGEKQTTAAGVDPKKTEASVDIYYEGKNTGGVDIDAGISISNAQRRPNLDSKLHGMMVNSPYFWYKMYPYDTPSTADINRRLDSLPYAQYTPQMRSLQRRIRSARKTTGAAQIP